MRRGRYLRLDRRARAMDREARLVGKRFIHRATVPLLMGGTDPRTGFLVDSGQAFRPVFPTGMSYGDSPLPDTVIRLWRYSRRFT